MKLTPAQIGALQAIAAGDVHQRNMGYAAWRIQGASPGVVGKLVAGGLAKWLGIQGDFIHCAITDAGRSALAETQP